MSSVQRKLDDHFLPYAPCFESATRSVAASAKDYLRGLYQSCRANMERMADVVAGSRYQRLHHMLSESAWDRAGVLRQLVADANAHFGRGGTALVIDESGFAKKGDPSAGVARQWNGIPGTPYLIPLSITTPTATCRARRISSGTLRPTPANWL